MTPPIDQKRLPLGFNPTDGFIKENPYANWKKNQELPARSTSQQQLIPIMIDEALIKQ